jgi:hypothetical protein
MGARRLTRSFRIDAPAGSLYYQYRPKWFSRTPLQINNKSVKT